MLWNCYWNQFLSRTRYLDASPFSVLVTKLLFLDFQTYFKIYVVNFNKFLNKLNCLSLFYLLMRSTIYFKNLIRRKFSNAHLTEQTIGDYCYSTYSSIISINFGLKFSSVAVLPTTLHWLVEELNSFFSCWLVHINQIAIPTCVAWWCIWLNVHYKCLLKIWWTSIPFLMDSVHVQLIHAYEQEHLYNLIIT
jgi:hypothetical protein